MTPFRTPHFALRIALVLFLTAPFAPAGLIDGKHHHKKQTDDQKAAKAARKDTALYAIVSPGAITIKSGKDVLCKVTPAHPNIEGYRIVDEKYLAIKSRDNPTAPALVELFTLPSGTLKNSVLAREVDSTQAWEAWAKE